MQIILGNCMLPGNMHIISGVCRFSGNANKFRYLHNTGRYANHVSGLHITRQYANNSSHSHFTMRYANSFVICILPANVHNVILFTIRKLLGNMHIRVEIIKYRFKQNIKPKRKQLHGKCPVRQTYYREICKEF